MDITVKYTGRIGEQTDLTVRGILDNFSAHKVSEVVGAAGEAPGEHVMCYRVDDARAADCTAQLDQYKIDWYEGEPKPADPAPVDPVSGNEA